MRTGDLQTLIAVCGFLAGVGSTLLAALRWYGNGQKKAYAAEREFLHLKGNQEQMQQQLRGIENELDEAHQELKALNTLCNVLVVQLGQGNSGILAYRKRENPE